jgi:hypothetical protein
MSMTCGAHLVAYMGSCKVAVAGKEIISYILTTIS